MTDVAGGSGIAPDPTIVIEETGASPDADSNAAMLAYVLERAEAALAGAKAKRDKYAALLAACESDVAGAEAALAEAQAAVTEGGV